MKTRIFLFFLISVFVLIPDILANKIEVDLTHRVVLKEKTITFSDVSTVTGDDVDLVNEINNIEIGMTPWANSTRRIDLDFLKMRLKSSNVTISDVTFTNSKSVVVSVESTKVTGHEIAQKAKEYLLSALPDADRETTVELVRMPGDKWIPRSMDDIDFDISLPDISKDRGNIDVIVSATSDGKRFFKIPVSFKVRVYEYVAIAKRRIGRNQQLTKRNLSMARRETTKIRGFAFFGIEDLVGMVTTTSIQPNTILTENEVEMPPTIKQGSIVKLLIQTSGFRIVTKGMAQQTGYTGEVIKVKNMDSKKLLFGEIIDSDSIRISF
ncbi:MAG: flagellar basal body P-ring formation protein FlgA [Candidatus Scalindua sp.]|jgi:flagellar basal body P-ring formation protein FlgA|nr:flagellar basal body P-ring formation protein FlgA [Candidatus Scalindua sp.]MBT6564866.1 flagellar basal body P-ring formation protein FlgA [Candidatus Scalindua sp.]MBT7592618.1 flagellar basal body P-ring formation protein FlgA [Candidatus Scalindua sp.]